MKKKLIWLVFASVLLLKSCDRGIEVGLPPIFSMEAIYPNPARTIDTITLGIYEYDTGLRLGSGDKLIVIAKKATDTDTLKITGIEKRRENPKYSEGHIISNPYIEVIRSKFEIMIQCDISNLNEGNWTIEVSGGKWTTTSKVRLIVFK
ncbi:MAG: hypothetical protein M9949_13095 [Candidatus Kapabacteria bacterium]|nr:hypothetical protein [Candidatus Kapabacteria bacterium]